LYAGFLTSIQSASAAVAIRNSYLRVVGLELDIEANSRGKRIFLPEEEARFLELSRKPDLYTSFSKSIAPSIYGNEGIAWSFILRQ
jgi:DNA replication licensing factor MCM5